MMNHQQRVRLLAIVLVLFVPIIFLQSRIDPLRHQYEPGAKNTGRAGTHLPIEFALLAVSGFREVVAGLLWVRTDEFFHNGDYESIPPMIRIITWLDPHQIDVYETGAWHLDYNFTDSGERSDRRQIASALALEKEGVENNPDVPDLQSDLAFTHYFRKIGDFPKARDTYIGGWDTLGRIKQEATAPDPQQISDMEKADVTVGHGLAHAYEAVGDIPAATAQWQKCVDAHTQNMAKDPQDYAEQASMNSATRQLNEIKLRAKWRPRDTKVPLDMKFHPILIRKGPMDFVVTGTMNVIGSKGFVLETGKTQWAPADGCRVEVRLEDLGYKMPILPSYTLNTQMDPNVTIMQDAISTRHEPTETNGPAYIGGKKGKEYDLSKDHPAIYSFKSPRYQFTFWFQPNNPNDCPLSVQDRIGWMGEGMTDAHYLDSSGIVPGDTSVPVPHLRILKKTIYLTRDDIMGTGRKVFE